MSRTKVQCSKSVHVITDERPLLVLGKKILVWTNPSIFCEIERVVPVIIAVLLKKAPLHRFQIVHNLFFSLLRLIWEDRISGMVLFLN